MLRRLFFDHPASVGETYWQHQAHAFSFGGRMTIAGLACLAHGLFPALFVRTGSRTIAQLHDRMVVNRLAVQPLAESSAAGLETAE